MKIPVLNCSRVYINSNRISLIIDNKKNFTVTNDGWCILKHCDGTKNLETIFVIITNEFEVSHSNFLSFFELAEKMNIIRFIPEIEKTEFKIYGGTNIFYPQSFAIELTHRCNLECKYCYGDYKRSSGLFLDFPVIVDIFNEMKDNGVITIELTGGEPLLHPNFKEILLLALKSFSRVNILSNGVLFTDDIFRIIENNLDKIYLQISIDGCSEETNYKVRGVKNTWKKSFSTIKTLKRIGARYRVPFMITSDNLHEMEKMCELFNEENLNNLVFSPVSPSFGRACDYSECKLKTLEEDYLKEISNKLLNIYPNIFHKLLNHKNNLPIARDNCGSGWQHATISPSGIIKSCIMLDENSGYMGNVHFQSILDIFNSEKSLFYANFNKEIDSKYCLLCEYRYSCGNCFARIFLANKDRIKNGEGLCHIVKEMNMDKYFNFEND